MFVSPDKGQKMLAKHIEELIAMVAKVSSNELNNSKLKWKKRNHLMSMHPFTVIGHWKMQRPNWINLCNSIKSKANTNIRPWDQIIRGKFNRNTSSTITNYKMFFSFVGIWCCLVFFFDLFYWNFDALLNYLINGLWLAFTFGEEIQL